MTADKCRPVVVDGEVIRVHGGREMDAESQVYFAEIVRAAKRRFEAVDVLPGMPEPSPVTEADEALAAMSAGQRLTERQRQDVKAGRHPLTGGPLHDMADTTARAGDPTGLSYRCGSCVHRVSAHHNDGHYPKCDLSTITRGQASDVRAWWPACPKWEATP